MKKAVLVILVALIFGLCLWAMADVTTRYPQGYRNWVHISSAMVGKQSPFFEQSGGLHHIYANEKAMQGYRTGHFPDGSVIVFDLLETKEMDGTFVEGPRRLIDVMTRDAKRFARTGGWGFEEFKGDSQTERTLTDERRAACYNCHIRKKDHEFVFSVFRP